MDDAARVRALLAWYDAHARDLPWRRDVTPYRTWVSEVMLQQTRVEAVLEPYARFLARWPTLAELATAELDEVLAAWTGLGYYRRARLLHRGARYVAEELGGELPRTRAALRKVPGIGPYTAGALLSIAMDQPEPLVDGNVERVLTRWQAWGGDPRKAPLKRRLWDRAQELVPADRPGDWNQALMELGATCCVPRGPRCEACPVAAGCAARAAGDPTRYPELAPRKASVPLALAAVVVRHRGRVLLLKRGEDESLMPGLWELPTVEAGEADPAAALAARVGAACPLRVEVGPARARVRHGILRWRITLAVHEGRLAGSPRRRRGEGWALVPLEELAERGTSSMVPKALGALGGPPAG